MRLYLYWRQKKNYLVHRLVAQAFIPNPDNKPEVNHINGIKTDNRASNLEYMTAWENNVHAISTGARERKPSPKLSMETVREIRQARQDGEGIRAIAKRMEINKDVVCRIVNGKSYKEE